MERNAILHSARSTTGACSPMHVCCAISAFVRSSGKQYLLAAPAIWEGISHMVMRHQLQPCNFGLCLKLLTGYAASQFPASSHVSH